MKIVFLYPAVKDVPNGGLKIVYEYANMFGQEGHNVSIVFATYFSSINKSIFQMAKCVIKYTYVILVRKRRQSKWFYLNDKIEEKFVWNHSYRNVPKGDCYIATAVTTAPYLKTYPIPNSHKFYLIQGYETFIHPDETFIKRTYQYPFTKIAVSKWLQTIVEKEGHECFFVPNGFNPQEYYLTTAIQDKNKYEISMLYHTSDVKDSSMGLRAVQIAKNRIPAITVSMFGVHDCPLQLPSWITYYKNPTHQEHLKINNKAAIHIGTSKKEGWGLTIGEAMMCGQAIACTDNLGYQEMAIQGRNALISPVGDEKKLADNIVKLIEDDGLRIQLAENGLVDIKKFDQRTSYEKFKSILLNTYETKHNYN